VEEKKHKLCIEILKRFNNAGILKNIIVIGSWSIYFYKYYFNSSTYSTYIRTTDIDFLVPVPPRFDKEQNVFELVEGLGFREMFSGSKGYIKLKHADLTIEFLVPERGRGSDTPYQIPKLKINAQPLRYLDFIVDNTIAINFKGMRIKLAHPAAYALHKFIIFKRRRKKDKHDRDIEGAMRVFGELIKQNKHKDIKKVFNKMHKKWQQTVLENLNAIGELEVINVLKN